MRKISRHKVLAEFGSLRKGGFPEPAFRRLEAVVGGFLAENPRLHEPGERARRTLKHLRRALAHRDGHADSTVRQAARKLLKTAGHTVAFEELEGRARKFAGLLKKTGHNRRQKALMRNVEKREAGDGCLVQVVSKSQLRSIGKQLALCVARMKWAGSYFGNVEDGATEIWVYRRDDGPYALIELDASDRTIAECQAHEGESPKFKAQQARAILAVLEANGDNHTAFTRVGAYSAFGGDPPPETVSLALDKGRPLRLWAFPSEIIVATRKTGRKRWRWSRFHCEDDCWQDDWSSGLQLGELFELARTRPDIRKHLGFAD